MPEQRVVLEHKADMPFAHIAVGGVMPCNWKKRMLTATRAAVDGIARLTYDTASCRA